MTLSNEILEIYEQATTVLIPKGENRAPVTDMLEANGIEVPDMPNRCLHAGWQRNP